MITIKALLRWNAEGQIAGFTQSGKGNYRVQADITHFVFSTNDKEVDFTQQAKDNNATVIITFTDVNEALSFQAGCAQWRQENLDKIGTGRSFLLVMQLHDAPTPGNSGAFLITNPFDPEVSESCFLEIIKVSHKTAEDVAAMFQNMGSRPQGTAASHVIDATSKPQPRKKTFSLW